MYAKQQRTPGEVEKPTHQISEDITLYVSFVALYLFFWLIYLFRVWVRAWRKAVNDAMKPFESRFMAMEQHIQYVNKLSQNHC